MDDQNINLIESYKTHINQSLLICSQNEGIFTKDVFDKNAKCLIKPEIVSDTFLLEIYADLNEYEKSNTDDKLRVLYNRLDSYAADIMIKYPKNLEKLSESSSKEDDIEDAENLKEIEILNYFTKIGLKEENIGFISSLSDFISFTSSLSLDYLSRGQSNYEWKLVPSALRKNAMEKEDLYSEDDVKWMFEEFKRALKHYDKAYSSKNILELESYAQHYSIPTNLIDFTEAHSISLLFALEKYESNDYSIVYFVDAQNYNTNKCFKGKVKPIPNCSGDDCDAGAACIFMKSDNVNERIHYQKGYFLKVPYNYEKEDLLEDLKDYTKVLLIAPSFKESILTELFLLGITFQDIYPDLNNLANSIKFRNRIKQRGNQNE